MRHHLSVLWVVTSLLLLSFVGCSGDSMKSSQRAAEDISTSTVAEGKETHGEPSSGEVQERAVTPFRPPAPVMGANPGTQLPNPVVALVRQSFESSIVGYWEWIYLTVTNYAAYPDVMFARTPSLPPCEGDYSAPRTVVVFYAQNGSQISQNCEILTSNGLASQWFYVGIVPVGSEWPTQVRVGLWDRLTSKEYMSNWVALPQH